MGFLLLLLLLFKWHLNKQRLPFLLLWMVQHCCLHLVLFRLPFQFSMLLFFFEFYSCTCFFCLACSLNFYILPSPKTHTHTHMHTPSLSFENQCTQPSLWTPSLVPPNWITVPPPVWYSGKCTQCLSQSRCPINVCFILSFPMYIIKTVWITPYCILLFACPLQSSQFWTHAFFHSRGIYCMFTVCASHCSC